MITSPTPTHTGSPGSPDYGPRGNEFSGHIRGVQLAIAEELRASITSSRRRKLSASLWRGSRDSHNDFRIGGLNRPPITGINAALLVALDTRTLF